MPYVDVKGVLEILNSLYPNKAFALVRENLQNSIDAGSRNIWLTFDPSDRRASFVDDGTGISVARMNEREYFALMWSTKRGKDLIGSKGIGRLTNIAAARSVLVETNDGHRHAVFSWHSTGSFAKRKAAPKLLHRGLSLTLQGLRPIVTQDLSKKVDEVATDVFDDYLRKGVAVWFNGTQIKPKEYRGQRKSLRLKAGGDLHLYWNRDGQPLEDQGVVMKCRGARVGTTVRFGIESEEWRNVAGVLHLDHLTLTANRDAFEDTEDYRASIAEAIAKVRAFLARHEGGRKQRLDEMAEQYTKAALEAAKSLGIDLALLGPPGSRSGTEAVARGQNPGPGQREISEEPAERDRPPNQRRKEGDEPGFRLIPRKFMLDEELRPYANDMTWRRGPVIFVNLGHPACPENRFAQSFYIWCCAFVELVRWGGLSPAEDLPRDRLLASYKGWLQRWNPSLARYTKGGD